MYCSLSYQPILKDTGMVPRDEYIVDYGSFFVKDYDNFI